MIKMINQNDMSNIMNELEQLKAEKEILQKEIISLKSLQKQPEEVFLSAPKGLIVHTINNTNDLVYWVNQSAEIIYANDAVIDTLHYPKDELLKLKLSDIYQYLDIKTWLKFWSRIKKEKTILFEQEFKTKKGDILVMEISATFLIFESQEYVCAIMRDITERKENEIALQLKEAHKKALLSAIPDLIFIMDDNGIYTDFRGGNGQTFIPQKQIIGTNIKDSGMDNDLVNRILERNKKVLETNEIIGLEYKIVFDGFKVRYYEDRAVKYSHNQVIRVVRETTEKIEYEQSLQQINEELRIQNEQMQTYSHGVSHNLRSPITTILGVINLIENNMVNEDEQKMLIEAIKIHVQKLDIVSRELNETLEHIFIIES